MQYSQVQPCSKHIGCAFNTLMQSQSLSRFKTESSMRSSRFLPLYCEQMISFSRQVVAA